LRVAPSGLFFELGRRYNGGRLATVQPVVTEMGVALGSRPEIGEAAERLRREPYRLLLNNCLIKSVRLAGQCRSLGVEARVVLCLGLASARLPGLDRRLDFPAPHAWVDVEGDRIELCRALGWLRLLNIAPDKVKPLVKLRL